MEIFVEVVEAGSLTAAAAALRHLVGDGGQAYAGARSAARRAAHVRTTRRQSLTEIGREYYERCRRILADVNDAESLAEAMSTAPRGVLR